MYARHVSTSVVDDPACPELPAAGTSQAVDPARAPRLSVERRPVAEIDRQAWDSLAAATPWSTPFSAWAYHTAWWDGYGANARDETLLVTDPSASPGSAPVAILPLMRRHAVEPSDAVTQTELRHEPHERHEAGERRESHEPHAPAPHEGHEPHQPHDADAPHSPAPARPPAASVLYMGASYHGDYATVLAAPEALSRVAPALVEHLATATPEWQAADLRRLRCGDPAAEALETAFRARAGVEGWQVTLEREDVCPVATIPEGADFDGFLATLGKKERHEIRRKIRRAEASGEVCLVASEDPLAELDAFIDLHQARWGAAGLFPPTPGGEQSRRFLRRLFELLGTDGPLRLSFLSVGGRRIAAGLHFETPDAVLYYNAGVDPEASQLSPGVLLVAAYVRLAIATGRRRLDFLRGDESYKYQWGGVDEPVQRLLVERGVTA
jgi:CelD/BcsL family acetyltransferase involved in cellulose biosynthesis